MTPIGQAIRRSDVKVHSYYYRSTITLFVLIAVKIKGVIFFTINKMILKTYCIYMFLVGVLVYF